MDGKTETTWRKSVPVECAMGRAIVTDRFKYMVYDIDEQQEQLIDLAADPHELRNARHDPHLQTFLPQLREMHTSTFVNAIRKQEDVLLDLGEG
jgi:arylsulfatase A-like enzyme